jgi:hypothetical protein
MLQKSRGVFFLRSPKRRRQPPPVAQLGGTLKPVKLVHLLVRTNFGDEIDILFKCSYAQFPCSHSSFACTGTHYVCRLGKLQIHKLLDLFFETFKCPYEHFPCVQQSRSQTNII